MFRKFFFYICLVLIFTNVNAQIRVPYEYKQFTTKDGLLSDEVHHILQDSRKYLWFCTSQGVSRFDGRHFENFGLAEGLADNEILYCTEDGQSRLWFHSFNGRVSYFDLKTNHIHSYRNDTILAKLSLNIFIKNIVEYEDNIWLQSEYSIKCLKANKEVINYSHVIIRSAKIIFIGNDKNLYCLMDFNSIYRFNKAKNSFEFVSRLQIPCDYKFKYEAFDGALYYENKIGISKWTPQGEQIIMKKSDAKPSDFLNRINIDSINNAFWLTMPIGTWYYPLNCFDKKIFFKHITNSTSVLTDHEGNKWIASLDNGVFLLPKDFQYINHFDKAQNDIGEIHALARDPLRNLILFSTTENSLCVLYPNGKVHTIKILSNENLPIKKIFTNGCHVWIQINNNKILLLHNLLKNNYLPKSLVLHEIFDALYENLDKGNIAFNIFNKLILPTKNMFFASNGHTYFLSKTLVETVLHPIPNSFMVDFNKIQGNSEDRMYGIDEDENGMIWYGGLSGLYQYNPKTKQKNSFNELAFESSVNDIACMNNNLVLVGTAGNGVYLVKKNTIIAHWGEKTGLGSNICNRLYKQDNNHIWVATARGAVLLSFDNQDITKPNILIYGGSDNQGSQMVNDILVHDNQLYLATKDGLYNFSLRQREHYRHTKPILQVLEPQIFLHNTDSILQLSARCWGYDNQVKFRFQTVAFLNGESIAYYYELYLNEKLHRSDSALVNHDLLLPFLSLPSGNYELHIRSSRAGVQTEKPLILRFNVPRPYLLTPFAILCYILFVGYLTYRIINFLNKSKKEQEAKEFALKEEKLHYEQVANNARRQMIELEQENIRGKIDPHFIFNALNGLMSYVYMKNLNGIKSHLPRLARIIRRSLELSKKEWITVEEEISYLEDYLSLEKMRFEELFEYKIIVEDPSLNKELIIVPLILQIFAENSIKHGFLQKPDGQQGLIEIFFQKISQPTEGGGYTTFVRCVVRDNGIGLLETPPNTEYRSMGIQLVKKRIDLINEIHQKKYKVFVQNRTDNILGVEAILVIPLLQ